MNLSHIPPSANLASTSDLLPSSTCEPSCSTEASKHKKGWAALAFEMDALLRNDTCCLVLYDPSMKILGCKWVFRVKRNSSGAIERYMDRLVPRDFTNSKVMTTMKHSALLLSRPVAMLSSLVLLSYLNYKWGNRTLE